MPEALHFQLDEYYLDLQKQGQDVELMDREETLQNPFPGLRPFRTGEAHLFFGREGQAEALIGRLMQTHFLGVLGNSGSGKSSLARAGLIPALHAGKKQNRVSDWKIVICRPGNSPVQNLAAALAGANKNTTEEAVLVPEVQRLLPLLQESSFGLLEAEEGAGAHDKTLLIVDQFEELFRFENEIPAGEAAHFVDILLTAVQQENAQIYVVITMRSEFLGECVRYRGLPEIINEGQYLVPRLTGDNVRRAVAGPLGVVGAPVDATLVNRLVREVGDNMDQLPLLQHALMRTYRRWQQRGAADTPITHADYEAVGGMGEALGRHADEHFRQLDPTGQAVAKLIFQRLTDLSAGDKGGRRPTLMAEIYGLAQALPADRAAVNRVIDQFRQLDTSFLMPPPGAPLQEESMLDISHESLIRNWAQMNNWAKEEAENARLYQRLQQARAEHDEDPSQGWITGALLQRLADWRAQTPLNHFWAARYHPTPARAHDWSAEQERYERNMAFLDECQKAETDRAVARDAEIAEKARGKQRARYRNIIIALMSAAAVVAAGLAIWAFREKVQADEARQETAVALAKVDSLRTIAEAERDTAAMNAELAYQKTLEAEANLKLADKNLKKAQAEEARAKAALEQVEKEKAATEEQRQVALKNYEDAQKQRLLAEKSEKEARDALEKQRAALEDVVRLTLAEVDRLIYDLDYEAAHEKIRTVQNLGVSEKTVSDALLELAFWYAETGVKELAWGVLDTAYALTNRRPADRSAGPRATIRALNSSRDSFLQQRYYPVMVDIPGGRATIGADTFVYRFSGDTFSYPPFVVRVQSFQMARTETTWWQYMLYCTAAGVEPPSVPGWGMKGDNPVVNVSWYYVVEYTNWLSKKLDLPEFYVIDKSQQDTLNKNDNDDLKWTVRPRSNGGYRLPTEAEWEYAARAGTNWKFAGCNTEEELGDYAWYDDNSESRTRGVGRKKPNPFGLYDMSGNVFEWCWDWYGDYPAEADNYSGPPGGEYRVLRGGSWGSNYDICRSAVRVRDDPDDRYSVVGFRVSRHLK